jgi:two-component system, chemotaxis family, chemotaxis protein CheY
LARKILLADDSVTAQNMGRKILADAGYEVITVNNGSAALKKIAETKPDIIILDVYMPGYSGLEVCQRLKEVQETSRIPVLLTVGKLEPFKPEEAKRVRAEGYIVKPFEASELLSTLSKLEDKIVPRAEPSKPGRFARANAAIDESRYDKTTSAEEDSGWKNRIGFPSKNKKAAQDEGDDSAIYNAVNKDLRTVIDRKQATDAQEEKAQAAKAEEARFDLGALAPEGLPKDVTPEEIAALAAAAAQVGSKLGENAFADAVPEQAVAATPEVKAVELPAAEAQPVEAKAEVQPAAEAPKESPAATFAEQKPVEAVEAATVSPFEAVKEGGVAVPSATEMMAAIAGLVPEAGPSTDSSSGNGFGSHGAPEHHAAPDHAPGHHAPERSADEPVTMAAAAGAGFGASAARWTAVAVALAPDEAAISLEHEMQKAYAAFAAAEVAHAATTAPVHETQPAALEPQATAQISSSAETAESVAPAVTVPEATHTELAQSEVAQSISAVAGAATEALSGAVKEFERVAASFVEPQPVVATPAPEAPEPPPVQAAEPVAQPAPETVEAVAAKSEAKFDESQVAETPASQPEEAKSEVAKEPLHAEQKHEEQKPDEAKRDEPSYEEAAPVAAAVVEEKSAVSAENPETATTVANETSVSEASVNEASADHASSSEGSARQVSGYRSFANDAAADQTPAGQVSSEIAPLTAVAQPVVEGTKDVTKKESDIAETTAAAWASWRRIRESGNSKASPSATPKAEVEAEPAPAPQNEAEAAMAVAAGAEKSPEEIPAAPEESGEIASIVDSMLADMRPRIVEEVSRKLGKKK